MSTFDNWESQMADERALALLTIQVIKGFRREQKNMRLYFIGKYVGD
jgi:hypothetical protein